MRAAAPLLLSVGAAAAASPSVYYYQTDNYDTSKSLSVASGGASAELRSWKTSYRIYDSAKDVVVQRLDVAGPPKAAVQLYASAALSLAGPAYLFANASYTITDAASNATRSVAYTDAVTWLSGGACVRLGVTLGDTGVASLLFVSSGALDLSGAAGAAQCTAGFYLVGQELRQNWVPYTLTNTGSCTNALSHGDTPEYSNMDGPIGPLDAHYHTRGALYYILYGTAQMNDRGTYAGTVMGAGDLRFVNSGVYYGPEEMDRSSSGVWSVHEVDPSAIAYSNRCACEDGYDYQNDAGGVAIGAVPSQAHCCGLCSADSKCKVAIYAGGACYLKYSAEGKTAKSGAVACQRATLAARAQDDVTQCPFACMQEPAAGSDSKCMRA